MRRWLIVCIAVSAILLGTLSAARALGRRQAPTFHTWLKQADGRPCPRACLFGVAPDGRLSFEEAYSALSAHPLLREAAFVNRGEIRYWTTSAFKLSIGRAAGSDRLMWIQLEVPYSQRELRVSDLLAAYGTPDYILATEASIVTDLLYAAHNLQASALREALPDNVPLRLSHRIYSAYLLNAEQFKAHLQLIGDNLKAWRGFVPITQYFRRATR